MPCFHDWVKAVISSMTHSYKPILCLSIIKNVDKTITNSQTISKERICCDVARFYWEIHDNKFHIRHGPTTNHVDELVQSAIRKTELNNPNTRINWRHLKKTLECSTTLHGTTTYLDKIWKNLRKHPFHYMKIPPRTLILTASGVEIPSDSVRTINANRKILDEVSILKLIDFLEKFNRSFPNIPQKVRKAWKGGKRGRYPPWIEKALEFMHPRPRLCKLQTKNKCTAIATQWDHVIPWSHIGNHDIWNLMPICSDCNINKSDKKPIMSYIRKTETRNILLLNELDTNPPPSISGVKLQELKVELQQAAMSSSLRTNHQSMP